MSTPSERPDQTQPASANEEPGQSEQQRAKQPAPKGRPAAAWTAVTVGVVLALGLVIFIAQNTESVPLSFLGFDGSAPLAVALLAAAVVGAAVVLLVGTIRVTQLKLAQRRLRHDR